MVTYIQRIDGKWYAYAADTMKHQCYSIGQDNPKDGGMWFAPWTEGGVKYVATASPSRDAAYRKASRYGDYAGEIK